MSISVQCPGCQKKLKANDELAGKRVKCPNCAQLVVVLSVCSAPLQPTPPNPSPRKSPPRSGHEATASPAPQSRPVRWPWYAGGGAAFLCVLAIVISIFAMPGKDRTPAKNAMAAVTPPESKPEPTPEPKPETKPDPKPEIGALVLAATAATAQQPTKPKDPPTIQDDLKALAGDEKTTWELSKKDAQGKTILLIFYRDKDATAKAGHLLVGSERKAAAASFTFKVEEKDKRRFLNAAEYAFNGEGAEARLPYVLQGDTLRIEGGKASNQEFGVVELKGEWKRAKTELKPLPKPEPESKQPEDVAKSIQKGGKFWSSPVKVSRGDTSFAPGDRFWVWPVEDRVFEAEDGKLPIKFHWRVRPGQKPSQEKNDPVFANIDFLSEGGGATNINFQGHRLELKTGASEGIFELTFDVKTFSGEGGVLFFLSSAFFSEKTDSNLLLLKVKFTK